MRSIGHPLVGDPTYGQREGQRGAPRGGRRGSAPPATTFPRQALHAAQLGLIHPASGAACEFRSELPADMRELIGRLRR
jgi:23S rRNA pseudouridine1911/1915/1917 synthase